MSGSTRQWIRNASVVVADASGRGIEFGDLRIVFKVTHEVAGETPKTLQLRAFNLAPATAKVLLSKEFTRATLKVGYGNPALYGSATTQMAYEGRDDAIEQLFDGPPQPTGQIQMFTLFEGDIKQARMGRMNPTDTYVDILAGSSEVAYNFGFINKAVAAGYTPEDLNKAVAEVFAGYNVQQGFAGGLTGNAAPRGRVLFGLAREYARELAYTAGNTWSIADLTYDQVPVDTYIPDEAIVATSSTGMIGMPQITLDGVVVRCLMNPKIRGNRLVKLDNRSIQTFQLSPGYTLPAFIPSLQQDGTYKVIFCDHIGDTRGQEWYSDFVCHSIDESAAPTDAVVRAVGYNP